MEKEDLLLEQLKIASELHRHMDEMAWQGLSHLFMWNGILLSALGVVLASTPCCIRDASGNLKGMQLPCAIAACLVAILGATISIGWSFVQKRAQMYHRVRVAQAADAERALVELAAHQSEATESQPLRVYPDKSPLEVYREEVDEIPLKCFGKPPSHSVVFWIALAITVVWILVLGGSIYLVVSGI
jgi:hypothetical protein